MLSVTVKRSTWYRGQGPANSRLLRADGQMCCLGFASRASGLADDVIFNVPSPCSIRYTGVDCATIYRFKNALTRVVPRTALYGGDEADHPYTAEGLLVRINDDDRLTDDEREALLTRYAEYAGIVFTFED